MVFTPRIPLVSRRAWVKYRAYLKLSLVADAIGVSRQRVAVWTSVPEEHLRDVARVTGIDWRKLRPDLAPGYKALAREKIDLDLEIDRRPWKFFATHLERK